MKYLASVFLISISGCVFIPYNSSAEQPKLPNLYDQDYGTIEAYRDSLLNKFWAQEAIATPEARELIKEMQRNNFAFAPPLLGIADSGFDLRKEGHPRFSEKLKQYWHSNYESKIIPNMEAIKKRAKQHEEYKTLADDFLGHGTSTLGIIAGEEPVGVSSLGEIGRLSVDSRYAFANYAAADSDKIPAVINSSLTHSLLKNDALPGGGTRAVQTTSLDAEMLLNAKKFLEKTIYVTAAGNDFPQPIDTFKKDLGNKMIIVGSADPGGFPSTFSQVSEHVVVLAPSDNFLQSIDADGKIVRFGGTSGAAPMVSGVLADVKSILPSLTRDEAVYMLQKTATRTTINNVSTVNGAGVLNHYKMLRVAKRLHEAGFANNRQLLYDDAMYDFSIEARQLASDARKLLSTANDFFDTEGFKKLRKAFFLDTDYTATRAQLAGIYNRCGHKAAAELYRVPLKKLGSSLASISSRSDIIEKKVFNRKTEAYIHHHINEGRNFSRWLRTKKTLSKEDFSKFTLEIELVAKRNNHLLYKILGKKSALEVLDSGELLTIMIHKAHSARISDKAMLLLLEYTAETAPEVLDQPRVLAVIKERASALTRLADVLGEHGKTLRRILRLAI